MWQKWEVCTQELQECAKEISVGAATSAVLWEVDGIFKLKEQQKRHWSLFSVDKMLSLCYQLALARAKLNTAVHNG